jgi:hypothetical protein
MITQRKRNTEMTSTTTYLKPHNECCEEEDENSMTSNEGLNSSNHSSMSSSMSSCMFDMLGEVKDDNSITGNDALNSSTNSMSSFLSSLLAERAMTFDTSSICIVDDNARTEYDRRSMNLVKLRRPKSSIGLCRWGGGSNDQPVESGLPCNSRRPFSPWSSSSAAPLLRAVASDTMLLKQPVRLKSPINIKPYLGKASDTNFRWDQSNVAALKINQFDLLFEDKTKRKTSSSTTTSTGLKKSTSSSNGLKKSSSSGSGLKSSGKKKSSKHLKDRASLLGLDLK